MCRLAHVVAFCYSMAVIMTRLALLRSLRHGTDKFGALNSCGQFRDKIQKEGMWETLATMVLTDLLDLGIREFQCSHVRHEAAKGVRLSRGTNSRVDLVSGIEDKGQIVTALDFAQPLQNSVHDSVSESDVLQLVAEQISIDKREPLHTGRLLSVVCRRTAWCWRLGVQALGVQPLDVHIERS